MDSISGKSRGREGEESHKRRRAHRCRAETEKKSGDAGKNGEDDEDDWLMQRTMISDQRDSRGSECKRKGLKRGSLLFCEQIVSPASFSLPKTLISSSILIFSQISF